jgi:hypothetical protein
MMLIQISFIDIRCYFLCLGLQVLRFENVHTVRNWPQHSRICPWNKRGGLIDFVSCLMRMVRNWNFQKENAICNAEGSKCTDPCGYTACNVGNVLRFRIKNVLGTLLIFLSNTQVSNSPSNVHVIV